VVCRILGLTLNNCQSSTSLARVGFETCLIIRSHVNKKSEGGAKEGRNDRACTFIENVKSSTSYGLFLASSRAYPLIASSRVTKTTLGSAQGHKQHTKCCVRFEQ
jgi:hypothetical protein